MSQNYNFQHNFHQIQRFMAKSHFVSRIGYNFQFLTFLFYTSVNIGRTNPESVRFETYGRYYGCIALPTTRTKIIYSLSCWHTMVISKRGTQQREGVTVLSNANDITIYTHMYMHVRCVEKNRRTRGCVEANNKPRRSKPRRRIVNQLNS